VAASILWVFVDGLGLARAPLRPAGPTPGLDARLGGSALVEGELAAGRPSQRFALDATLGVEGLPGTATGQATLVTGQNAARAMGRHMQAFPGPRLRAWMDSVGSVFSRAAARGAHTALITSYPAEARETALRYAARTGGARLRDAAAADAPPLYPNLGLRLSRADAHDAAAAEDAAALAASLARPYDLSVVETDVCDRAGHLREGREAATWRALGHVDRFLEALGAELGRDDLLVVASDHGNVEDPTTRGHTRHRVPVLALPPGPADPWCGPDLAGDLTAFAPWLEDLVVRVQGGRYGWRV
jgi:2,3-bisphosphoglycerate-independent phosphoglycerate mutase